MFGGKPARGLPKPPLPPPTARRLELATLTRGETPNWVAKTGRQNETPEGGGGGGNSATFQITQQWSNISRGFFHTEVCVYFPLLIAVSYCTHLLSACCAEENGVLYSESEPIKGQLFASPQSTTLHSTGNISAEDSVYKNKVDHNNTRGIVSSLLFFPLELLLHKVYISNILCGLRL